jgi:signal transduction histidine kinase
VVSKVLQTGRPTLVPTLSDAFMVAHSQDAEHLRALRELGIRSAMVVPLAVRDDVIGAMTLASVAPERAYDDEDLALAMEVAHRCALAVTNARLFQKAEAARARAEHLVEQAKGLQALVDELSSPQSPDALAGFVMDAGGSAVGASTSGFWLLEGQTLRLLEARNYAPEQRERYAHVPLDAATPIAEAARGGEPVFVRTLSDYTARYGDDELRAPGADPVPRLSMALLPLIAEGELLGALAFVFHEERAFADDDQRFLRVLARHCALALARNRSLERERQTAHQAQLADRRKDEFLAMLGHELRNPLMPIMTALELMRMRGEGTLINERAIIDRQARHMLRLVDDLLDVSRITRGRIELVRKHVELAAVVRGAVETASVLFEQRAQKLTVDVAEQGLLIDGDEARLVQVTSNLLTNAAKYTDPGGAIDVRAAREGDTVVLRVRDTGVGMSAELLPRVFDLFAQGERTLDRSEGGLGLGLAIVKSIVQLHGGTAEATSEGIGRGCELIVRLPVVPDAPPPTPAPTPAAPRPAAGAQQRVLVVDDNKDAASLLAELLGLVGREVRVAYDGPSALVVAGAQKLDVALLDIGLPVMDGYELAERLQAAQPGIVLFAITGYGQPADVERAHAAGFRHHLVKPVELDQLLLLLDEAAKERG